MFQGGRYGLDLYGNGRCTLAGRLWAGKGLRAASTAGAGGAVMMAATAWMVSGWMILAGVLAAALLVYLVAVLLRPEDFS